MLLHFDLGGDISVDGHGDVNISLAQGPWSVALQTDTVDLRWAPTQPRGRAWVGLRFASFAAQMVISPWSEGAPNPAAALNGMYAGLDAGKIWYFSQGTYGGLTFTGRWYRFSGRENTEIAVPEARWVLTPLAVLGWWSPEAELRLSLGADFEARGVAPQLSFYGKWAPSGRIMPELAVQAQVAEGQDWLTTPRIGGLNPYVVPLAGAAWAEFRAEDYASLCFGPVLSLGGEHWSFRTGPLGDLVWWQGEQVQGVGELPGERVELGLGWKNRFAYRRFFSELDGGYAPTVERQDGVAWSLWARVGVDWESKKKAKKK